jgi:competence protein ComEC
MVRARWLTAAKAKFAMFKIHFLNVGHGDCTIIKHASGHLTMIDINNGTELDDSSLQELSESMLEGEYSYVSLLVKKSLAPGTAIKSLVEAKKAAPLTNPVEFLKENYPNESLFRYIQTHPDLDHMRGLVALRSAGISIQNFWDTVHAKEPNFNNESDKLEWAEYQELQSGTRCKVHRFERGSKGKYFNEDDYGGDGDGISILSPTRAITKAANARESWNDLSYVLKVATDSYTFLLPGDAEAPVWDDLVANCKADLGSMFLKASHHGRDSGFHEEAVKSIAPICTIVSVGKKPDTDATGKYKRLSKHVLSTRISGTITISVDDKGQLNIESDS